MFRVYVKDMAGGLFLVENDEKNEKNEKDKNITVEMVKRKVSEIKPEYDFYRQKLFIGENDPIVLENDKKLSDYSLKNESIIYLFMRPFLWREMIDDMSEGNYVISNISDNRYGDFPHRLCLLQQAMEYFLLEEENDDNDENDGNDENEENEEKKYDKNCIIGLCHLYGAGVVRNEVEAMEWFRKSYNILGTYYLAYCYYHYAYQTYKNDIQYLLVYLAEMNFAPAQMLLGDLFATKMGPIYRDVANMWWKRAKNKKK